MIVRRLEVELASFWSQVQRSDHCITTPRNAIFKNVTSNKWIFYMRIIYQHRPPSELQRTKRDRKYLFLVLCGPLFPVVVIICVLS